jgi:hypothetical protein
VPFGTHVLIQNEILFSVTFSQSLRYTGTADLRTCGTRIPFRTLAGASQIPRENADSLVVNVHEAADLSMLLQPRRFLCLRRGRTDVTLQMWPLLTLLTPLERMNVICKVPRVASLSSADCQLPLGHQI